MPEPLNSTATTSLTAWNSLYFFHSIFSLQKIYEIKLTSLWAQDFLLLLLLSSLSLMSLAFSCSEIAPLSRRKKVVVHGPAGGTVVTNNERRQSAKWKTKKSMIRNPQSIIEDSSRQLCNVMKGRGFFSGSVTPQSIETDSEERRNGEQPKRRELISL